MTGRGLAKAISEYLREQGGFSGEDPTEAIAEAMERTGIQALANRDMIRRRKGIRARVGRSLLRRLGFKWREVGKGVYKDGHERLTSYNTEWSFLGILTA
jgi:hypothetical protein